MSANTCTGSIWTIEHERYEVTSTSMQLYLAILVLIRDAYSIIIRAGSRCVPRSAYLSPAVLNGRHKSRAKHLWCNFVDPASSAVPRSSIFSSPSIDRMARTVEYPSLTALQILANVCQAAKNLPTTDEELPPSSDTTRTVTPPPYWSTYPWTSHCSPIPGFFAPAQLSTAQENTTIFPTPPLTPERTSSSPLPTSHEAERMICVTLFDDYLEEAWPVNSQKRGCGVVRAALYDQIASSLRGDSVTAKIRHWVKESEFFLFHKGEGAGSTIAIPMLKGRGLQNHPMPGTYKLVARVEDFATIIANYHNDSTGHPGIRKTYGRVSVLYMWMQ